MARKKAKRSVKKKISDRTVRKLIVKGALIAAPLLLFFAIWLVDSRLPAFRYDGDIRVYPNSSLDSVLEELDSVLHVRWPSSVRRSFEIEAKGRTLCEGLYHIHANDPARYVARAITRGWQNPVKVMIPGNIRTPEALAKKIASQMMVTKDDLLAAFRNPYLLKKYGTSPEHLFEIIVPDTYQMYWGARPAEIIERLKAEHDVYWNEKRLEAAKKQGLTPDEVSILASIIAEESHIPSEYPKIASVYLTRLRKGMPLQACPTVCYCFDYKIRRVLKRHLKVDSPYNTYIHKGLPPTPICLPGKKHLEAVLHPDPTPYLYFCADPRLNGRNVFSVSFNEHSKKAAEYHDALDERNIK